MCLAIPMQVLRTDGSIARCSVNGIERDVSLYLLPPDSVASGDFVIVHVGYAIQKIGAADAELTFGLIGGTPAVERDDA